MVGFDNLMPAVDDEIGDRGVHEQQGEFCQQGFLAFPGHKQLFVLATQLLLMNIEVVQRLLKFCFQIRKPGLPLPIAGNLLFEILYLLLNFSTGFGGLCHLPANLLPVLRKDISTLKILLLESLLLLVECCYNELLKNAILYRA